MKIAVWRCLGDFLKVHSTSVIACVIFGTDPSRVAGPEVWARHMVAPGHCPPQHTTAGLPTCFSLPSPALPHVTPISVDLTQILPSSCSHWTTGSPLCWYMVSTWDRLNYTPRDSLSSRSLVRAGSTGDELPRMEGRHGYFIVHT